MHVDSDVFNIEKSRPNKKVADLRRSLEHQTAVRLARDEATDDSHGFWKDPRTIYGLILTCVFSGIFAALAWNVSTRSYDAGRRSVYETSCLVSCERQLSSMDSLREVRGTYTCFCENGSALVPVPSRLFGNLSGGR